MIAQSTWAAPPRWSSRLRSGSAGIWEVNQKMDTTLLPLSYSLSPHPPLPPLHVMPFKLKINIKNKSKDNVYVYYSRAFLHELRVLKTFKFTPFYFLVSHPILFYYFCKPTFLWDSNDPTLTFHPPKN